MAQKEAAMVRQRKEKWRKVAPEVDRALENRAAEVAMQDRDDLFTVDTTGPPGFAELSEEQWRSCALIMARSIASSERLSTDTYSTPSDRTAGWLELRYSSSP